VGFIAGEIWQERSTRSCSKAKLPAVHWAERLRGRISLVVEDSRKSVVLFCDGRPFLRVRESLDTEDLGPGPWLDAGEEAEIRGGPGVLAVLALGGRFCLHASAIERNGEATLFLGESGAGKSTLAREIGTRRPAWSRLTDDVSPVELAGGNLLLFPAFPQLKLPPEEQWRGGANDSIRVREVVVLEPTLHGEVAGERLDRRQSMLAVLRHTAAARLFDARLLERHFEFAGAAGQSFAAFRLAYPHRSGSPERVADWLERQDSPKR